jgi:hypothetical protein
LEADLKGIPKGRGVHRSSLYQSISAPLREHWGIQQTDAPDEVYAKVSIQLERLVVRLADPVAQRIARVSFNLQDSELDKLNLSDKNLGQRHGAALEAELTNDYETNRKDFSIRIIPDLVGLGLSKPAAVTVQELSDFLGERASSVVLLTQQKQETRENGNDDQPEIEPRKKKSHLPFKALIAVGAIAAIATPTALVLNHNSAASAPKAHTTQAAGVNAGSITTVVQLPVPIQGEYSVWVLPKTYGPSFADEFTKQGMDVSAWAPKYEGHFVGGARSAAGGASYVVSVTGNEPDGVIITNVGIHVISRQPPLTGTLIYVPSQGESNNVGFSYDLDSSDKVAKIDDRTSPLYGSPYFESKTITLNKNEPVTLGISAGAVKADYKFDLDFTVLVDGKVQHVDVKGPNGQPFEVSGFASSYKAVFGMTQSELALAYADPKKFCAAPKSPCGSGGN